MSNIDGDSFFRDLARAEHLARRVISVANASSTCTVSDNRKPIGRYQKAIEGRMEHEEACVVLGIKREEKPRV